MVLLSRCSVNPPYYYVQPISIGFCIGLCQCELYEEIWPDIMIKNIGPLF